jgi:hypothetical protein
MDRRAAEQAMQNAVLKPQCSSEYENATETQRKGTRKNNEGKATEESGR